MNEFAQLRQKAGLSIAEAARDHRLFFEHRVPMGSRRADTTPGGHRHDAARDRRSRRRRTCKGRLYVHRSVRRDRRHAPRLRRRSVDAASTRASGTRFPRRRTAPTFPATPIPIAGDITQGRCRRDPGSRRAVGGFPCQPFSIAGVSKKNALGRPHGFRCDAQGTLFFDVARIIEHHRPKAFLLENVKNLVSHDKGNTFRVIRTR